MATYAVGDIQGCNDEFQALLGHIGFSSERDRLILIGDLVNRGPDSLAVLRWAYRQRAAVEVVLGNHDLHLLAVAAGKAKLKGKDTCDDVLAAEDRELLLDWLRQQRLLLTLDDYALVHAGILPCWELAEAQVLCAEVEAELRGKAYRDLLGNMYGNSPRTWSPRLQGYERWRLIINACTRMRLVNADGALDFEFKGEPADIPSGLMPWFAWPGRPVERHTVVFGHWSALGLRLEPQLIALDTGCIWGRQLTAVRLEDRRVFQIPSQQPARLGAD
ncbi:symmetrical bis(5'-nucleosyl)-tetraphosphatase [Chitinimonas lacunae]|uniref:Bis(5'-nucleosyl)-tetraphosphatase, symmetrical n=1 Tax=Chitinimonas lacunae TaxID=1963018 RepID=A0ABV8MR13_9NEIS